MRDHGAWESWLAFFLRGVFEVSQQATQTAAGILTLRERHRRIITDRLGRSAANGHRVLEDLYRKPVVTVKEVRDMIGATYPAANNVVARFVEHGILREMTGQKRNRIVEYADYVDLFIDKPREEGHEG